MKILISERQFKRILKEEDVLNEQNAPVNPIAQVNPATQANPVSQTSPTIQVNPAAPTINNEDAQFNGLNIDINNILNSASDAQKAALQILIVYGLMVQKIQLFYILVPKNKDREHTKIWNLFKKDHFHILN